MSSDSDALRRGLLALASLGVVGTLVELATLRHWTTWLELVPWAAVAAAAGSLVALAATSRPVAVRLARTGGALLVAVGLLGLIVHVKTNLEAAPLDGTVGPVWDGLSIWSRLWRASTGGVGPAPPLAAASMVPTGLAAILATHRHPALAGVPRASTSDRDGEVDAL